MSRRLVIEIKPSTAEFDLDDYEEEGEEYTDDQLYDYFIHEVITQPDYDWKIVTT